MRRVGAIVFVLAIVSAMASSAAPFRAAGAGLSGAGIARTATPAAHPMHVGFPLSNADTSPRSTSSCLTAFGIHCYSPGQFEKAYGLAALHASGVDGKGTTIAIVDSFGSPTIRRDLHGFDQAFGHASHPNMPADPAILSDPKLTIIQPAGRVPAFNPKNQEMLGWAEETTLDVEWAHVFAPRANILLVETPTDETEGVHGFPEIVAAENYVITHRLATVISQSFGATEETFPSAQSILRLRSAFENASRHHVTVVAASGDNGATDAHADGSCCYDHAVNSWPSSDPLVTSVGGTQLTLDNAGNRIKPDVVWNDGTGASGGGTSVIFRRPGYQARVQHVTGRVRGTPDISMSAAFNGAVWIYLSFMSPQSPFHLVAGTSEAAPEFSGVVAMAAQESGRGLGLINNTLYHLRYGKDGLVDVTTGNNSFAGVRGFDAAPGYDLASGLGTIDATKFVRALARNGDHGGRG
jgi:subtilase family serine protease